jgi:hypothetical protein
VDNFTNPTANDSLNLPSHSTQHANANDAIEAVESYLLNGGQGLTLVKKQTIGTAVASVNVTGAFNSTYENYRIMMSGGANSVDANLQIQIGNATSAYRYAGIYYQFGIGGINLLEENNQALFRYVGGAGTNGLQMEVELQSPNAAKFTGIISREMIMANSGLVIYTNGYLSNTNQYTDFTISTSNGTMTGGTIFVYGYGKGQ